MKWFDALRSTLKACKDGMDEVSFNVQAAESLIFAPAKEVPRSPMTSNWTNDRG